MIWIYRLLAVVIAVPLMLGDMVGGDAATPSPAHLVLSRSDVPSGFVAQKAHALSAKKIAHVFHLSTTVVRRGHATGYGSRFTRSGLGTCCVSNIVVKWKTEKGAGNAFHSLLKFNRKHFPHSWRQGSAKQRLMLQSVVCRCSPGYAVFDSGLIRKNRYDILVVSEAKYKRRTHRVQQRLKSAAKSMEKRVVHYLQVLYARAPGR